VTAGTPSDDLSSFIQKAEGKGHGSGFCPFLGFEDDPETALAYPASYNYCYHCKPITSVSLAHQRSVCLTQDYPQCPVYQTVDLESMPKELRGKRPKIHRTRTWLSFVILLAVILLGLVVAAVMGLIRLPGLGLPVIFPTPSATIPVPTVVVTPFQSTSTPEPTPTPRPTATDAIVFPSRVTPRAIETPFGNNPQLVIHKLQEGEGYIRLAERFGTSVEAIKAINFELPDPLWVNTILVIPLNTDDVTNLPQFSVREITTAGLTIEAYAERMKLDPILLKQYNELPDGYLLNMGELLIIPN